MCFLRRPHVHQHLVVSLRRATNENTPAKKKEEKKLTRMNKNNHKAHKTYWWWRKKMKEICSYNKLYIFLVYVGYMYIWIFVHFYLICFARAQEPRVLWSPNFLLVCWNIWSGKTVRIEAVRAEYTGRKRCQHVKTH